MTARTVDLARWIFLTRQALTLVASFLAVVMFAIEGASTGLLAREASLSAESILHLLATIALYLFGLFARIARPWMALLLTLMNPAVQCLIACVFTAELTSTSYLTWNVLHLLAAVTANRHANVAGWTSTRVARNLTVLVLTVFVSRSLAMLSARVRQKHRVILRFFEATAVAEVFGHLVLCVTELAVRTGPIEEGKEFAAFSRCTSLLFLMRIFVALVLDHTTLFFLLVVSNVLFKALVEFLNPALDATKMEWLTTLTTIPDGRPLVDRIMANDALLAAVCKRLD